MEIPKKIHYFWVGGNIPENLLKRMMLVKYKNPNFEVNIWGNSNVKSLITNTLDKMKFNYQGSNFYVIGNSFHFNYNNIDTAFDYLTRQAYFQSAVPKEEPHCLSFFDRNDECEDIHENLYGDYRELILYLRHIYTIHLNGNCHNYASASDIARLAILYMEGGIYLDADVELSNIKTKKDKFSYLSLKTDMGIGDVSGGNWRLEDSGKEFGNAIISSLPNSKKIFNLIIEMAITIKRHHLYKQICDSPYFERVKHIKSHNEASLRDKRIDFILKTKEKKEIIHDEKCNFINPLWRTGLFNETKFSNGKKITDYQREERKITYTMLFTGPILINNTINPKNKNLIPKKYRLMSTHKNDNIFLDVDGSGDWSAIGNQQYSDEDPFS
ncbi:hypothetical protein FE392_01965 [Xenorhabdus sp. 12]|uniref:Subversion of eukaryotic traffic protein A n=1 Tax=Xenorhabdus santafensis TaxID=2582833 RepID=A0ABU4S623_9GAMM|nr:TcdA/TcdB catalytic glycosyltransferase domain-containing protein [Xenorhabdus sp. 12]MDX7986103.1 hypothetical protein [Xenorhabdus sp. 12]